MNSNSDSIIIDVDDLFKDFSEDDFILTSSDEEELSKTEFNETELQKLCEINCYVDLRRRNLYYEFEKLFRKRLLKRNHQYKSEHSDIIYKKFKKRFHKLYSKYYLKWEKRHEIYKPKRFRQNKRNAIQFLHNNMNHYNDDDDETENSQISSQTVIQRTPQIFTQLDNESDDTQIHNTDINTNDDSLENFMHNPPAPIYAAITIKNETEEFYTQFTDGIIMGSGHITSTQNAF